MIFVWQRMQDLPFLLRRLLRDMTDPQRSLPFVIRARVYLAVKYQIMHHRLDRHSSSLLCYFFILSFFFLERQLIYPYRPVLSISVYSHPKLSNLLSQQQDWSMFSFRGIFYYFYCDLIRRHCLLYIIICSVAVDLHGVRVEGNLFTFPQAFLTESWLWTSPLCACCIIIESWWCQLKTLGELCDKIRCAYHEICDFQLFQLSWNGCLSWLTANLLL